MRVLVVRPDRIGDLVLTLPSVEALRRALPEARIEALLAPRVSGLAACIPAFDGAVEDPGGLLSLAGRLRDQAYDLAAFPYASFRHVAAAALAGIPRRIGNGLRAFSPLFTDRVRVHRSRPPLHEAVYCLRLLEPLGIEPPAGLPAPSRLVAPPEAEQAADALLPRRETGRTPVVVVHPGGGGSAGRPAPAEFARFARSAALSAFPQGHGIVVTAGPGEEALADQVAHLAGARRLAPIPDLAVLTAMLGRADLFLAGSTGPLHLAAAAGAPVLGFYPWKASQQADRWRPLGSRVAVLSPDRDGCRACRDATCEAPECFVRITDEAVRAGALAATRAEAPA